ncbi:MAG: radical SAM protein [Promethearchaeota archaeon]
MDKFGKKEVLATIRTLEDGSKDLMNVPLTKSGKITLTDEEFNNILEHIRLRFSLTPRCNLWCIFCSNEGSSYDEKLSGGFADIDLVTELSDIVLQNTSLRRIDISGGEPTIHPDIYNIRHGEKSKLIEWTKKYEDIRFSFHSNGVFLFPETVDAMKNSFSRIGISIHSLNFDTWNRLSNNGTYSINTQKEKFDLLKDNLEYIASQNIGNKIFLKSVIMRGYNDSEKELSEFLEGCESYGFHPKFLQFDAQYPEQKKLVVGRKELFEKLERIGCEFSEDAPFHNDPKTYIPGTIFSYKSVDGLHSIFGCGEEGACTACYDFLCAFVKPTQNGDRLYFKPCSVKDDIFDVTDALRKKDSKEVLNIFKETREFLMTKPGLGAIGWNKDPKYRK